MVTQTSVRKRRKFMPADFILDRFETMNQCIPGHRTTAVLNKPVPNREPAGNRITIPEQDGAELENEKAMDNVISLLKSENANFHTAWAAIKAIEITGFKTAKVIEALVWALGWVDEFDCIMQAAGRTLLMIGAPAIPFLILALNDPNVRVQKSAIRVLMDFGPRAMDAVPALIKISRTGSTDLQNHAVQALIKIIYNPAPKPR